MNQVASGQNSLLSQQMQGSGNAAGKSHFDMGRPVLMLFRSPRCDAGTNAVYE